MAIGYSAGSPEAWAESETNNRGEDAANAAMSARAASAIVESHANGAIPPVRVAALLAQQPALDSMRYVARQPILDGRGAVHGYELLYRAGPTLAFSGDGNFATRDVLDQTATTGLDQLTGGLPVFINCTREALMDRLVLVLEPENTILELLETLDPTDDLLAMCHRYKDAGFRIALDDFEWQPAWDPFIPLADYIKVDISTTTSMQRVELVQRLKGRPTKLVAERVETQADLAMVRIEGFTLFQGYYFCRPVLLENGRIPENHLVHLQMLKALHEDPLDITLVSELIKRDASLTYRLLKMVNSPIYGLRKSVTSIRSALVLVGDEMFRRVATLAIASELKGMHPSELLRMAFMRGRFCELAAKLTRQDTTEQYLVGILSLFPAMLRLPMERVVDAMPLRLEAREALLGKDNPERSILEWLLCFELGQWECCDNLSKSAGLSPSKLPAIYIEAAAWAEENLSLTA